MKVYSYDEIKNYDPEIAAAMSDEVARQTAISN